MLMLERDTERDKICKDMPSHETKMMMKKV